MGRIRIHRVALLASALFGSACAVDPATWGAGLGGLTPERETAVGAEAASQVEREIGLVSDPQLVAYVRRVGERVARFSPRQDVTYRFHVADMAEPNAFALPGGYIYVSRGLLALANSEDELANVLGHEVAHVAARHASQRQSRQAGVGVLSVLGTVAAAVLGGAEAANVVSQIGQVAGAGWLASYSREQERESDRMGQEMAARAGVDPAAMAQFLRTLEVHERLTRGTARQASFLDSHPSNPARVAAAASLAATLVPGAARDPRASREVLLAQLPGLVVGQDPAQGVLRETTLLHPDLGFVVRFPSGWRVANRPSMVLAGPTEGDALLRLEGQGPGDDPRAAAEAFARTQQVRYVQQAALRGGSLPAHRALAVVDSQQGRLAVDLIWVAWQGSIYRLMGLAPEGSYAARKASFEATGRSFRPISASERAEIRVQRLRVVTAREGEALAALSTRTGNAWNLQETAVFNGLAPDVRLRGGTPVKIVRSEPYPGS